MAENYVNDFATTLSAAIASTSATTFTVASSTGAPAPNFRIRIDNEIMIVTGVASLTWTVLRGAEGTTAATHLNGAAVVHVLTAGAVTTLLGDKYDKTGGQINGDVELVGTTYRFKADFSTTPFSSGFQTSAANNITVVAVMPSGTGTSSFVRLNNTSDPANASIAQLVCSTSSVAISSSKAGTGTYLPITLDTSNVERMRITTNGGVLIGTTVVLGGDTSGRVHIQAASTQNPILVRNNNTATGKLWGMGPSSSNDFYITNQDDVGVALVDGSTSWAAVSDERMKTALTPIAGTDLWEWFKSIRTVTGRYKTDEEGAKRAFLIAQDWVERSDVTHEGADGMLSLAASNTLPYAYAVIKTAMERIEQLEAKVAALEAAR